MFSTLTAHSPRYEAISDDLAIVTLPKSRNKGVQAKEILHCLFRSVIARVSTQSEKLMNRSFLLELEREPLLVLARDILGIAVTVAWQLSDVTAEVAKLEHNTSRVQPEAALPLQNVSALNDRIEAMVLF